MVARRRVPPPPSEVDSFARKLLRLELGGYDGHVHAFAVTDWAVAMCRALGLRDRALVDVRLGALLHDIGKIYVGEDILSSPFELTPSERKKIRCHPEWGAAIVRDCTKGDAWQIPLYHHERWDGSGYPFGLKGPKIPLAARAFAVVDVYDALVMKRVYRVPQAYTPAQAWQLIVRGSGTEFDPACVKVFGQVSGLARRGPQKRTNGRHHR
jgi:putative nucleotidyltransferase with HDIG domain